MNKSLFLLVLLLSSVFVSCGKKLEDSDKKNSNNTANASGNSSDLSKSRQFLFNAIGSNDTILVKTSLGGLSDLNFIFTNGESPLTEAIKSSKSEIILEMLSKNADINKENKYFETPINLIILSERLHKTEKRDITKQLIAKKLNVNKKGINGITAIETAIRAREEAIAMLLIKNGANLTEAFTGTNLLELAKVYSLERLSKFFTEVLSAQGSTEESLRGAIQSTQRNLLEYLVAKNQNAVSIINNKDLLIEALKIQKIPDRLSILNYLLNVKGVNPDGKGVHTTPLIYAASQYHSTHKRSLSYLLNAGANIYHKDNRGDTALDLAARYLNVDSVSVLYKNILAESRDSFNTPGSTASNAILSACYKTPTKSSAERILWNGKQKRYKIINELRCPFN